MRVLHNIDIRLFVNVRVRLVGISFPSSVVISMMIWHEGERTEVVPVVITGGHILHCSIMDFITPGDTLNLV